VPTLPFKFTLIAAMVVLALATLDAHAVTSALLIGPDLQPREVKLQALGGGKISFFDAERTMQIEPMGKVLQIRLPVEVKVTEERAADAKPQAAGAMVEMIDGQRLLAVFVGADEEGQTLRFKHASLGEVAVNLDKVSRIVFEGSREARATPTTDLVLMTNGDGVTGFVVALKATGVEVQQGTAKPFTLPRERVKALILASPVVRAGSRHMAWLRDGSRLLADELSISGDKLTLASSLAGQTPQSLPLSQVDRLELHSLEGRLEDLADLPMTVTAGGKVFGLALPPRIENAAIHLHAPITVEFALPPGAKRFAALAELDAGSDDAALASFIVNVRAGGENAARHAISLSQPKALINAEVAGQSLSITLDPAVNGPVMDRLRLRDAVVFIEKR